MSDATDTTPTVADLLARTRINVEDIQITHEGLIVTLQRSKTDQEGQTIRSTATGRLARRR